MIFLKKKTAHFYPLFGLPLFQVLFTEDSADQGPEAAEFDEIRQKLRAIRGALQRSNTQQAGRWWLSLGNVVTLWQFNI